MIATNSDVSKWLHGLMKKNAEALEKANDFYKALSNTQYEGKISLGRNLREIEKTIKFFRDELSMHIKIEEEAIFPFLLVHVPKLDSMLRFLSAEHNELKSKLKGFLGLLNHLRPGGDSNALARALFLLRDEGTYLFCLLRNHFQTEAAGVYQVLDRELTDIEKTALLRKCSRLCK